MSRIINAVNRHYGYLLSLSEKVSDYVQPIIGADSQSLSSVGFLTTAGIFAVERDYLFMTLTAALSVPAVARNIRTMNVLPNHISESLSLPARAMIVTLSYMGGVQAAFHFGASVVGILQNESSALAYGAHGLAQDVQTLGFAAGFLFNDLEPKPPSGPSKLEKMLGSITQNRGVHESF